MIQKTLQEHLRITMAFRQENTEKARIRYENFKSETTIYQKEFLCSILRLCAPYSRIRSYCLILLIPKQQKKLTDIWTIP